MDAYAFVLDQLREDDCRRLRFYSARRAVSPGDPGENVRGS